MYKYKFPIYHRKIVGRTLLIIPFYRSSSTIQRSLCNSELYFSISGSTTLDRLYKNIHRYFGNRRALNLFSVSASNGIFCWIYFAIHCIKLGTYEEGNLNLLDRSIIGILNILLYLPNRKTNNYNIVEDMR